LNPSRCCRTWPLAHRQDFEPLEPLSIPGLANDTWEFIEALELEEPPNVLGWSMGGMLSVSLAALHGERLGKVRPLPWQAGLTCVAA
jgi:pimeloyl-ACP methyl ester carboxylesterase